MPYMWRHKTFYKNDFWEIQLKYRYIIKLLFNISSDRSLTTAKSSSFSYKWIRRTIHIMYSMHVCLIIYLDIYN